MIILKPVSNNKIWGTNRLYDYSGDTNIKTIGSVYSLSGIEEIRTKIIFGDENEDLYGAVKAKPAKFGLPEGVDYPIIIAFTGADEDLSIQVHPTDKYARSKEDKLIGKSESWYFINQPKKAYIYANSKLDDKAKIKDRIIKGDYKSLVDKISVKENDLVFIESGTLHALTKGALVYEIQQSTDITYRFYDYDRFDSDGKKRELHLEDAIATLDTNKKVKIRQMNKDESISELPYSLIRTKLCGNYKNEHKIAQAITVIKGKMIAEDQEINQGMTCMVLPNEVIKINKAAEEVIIATPHLYFRE